MPSVNARSGMDVRRLVRDPGTKRAASRAPLDVRPRPKKARKELTERSPKAPKGESRSRMQDCPGFALNFDDRDNGYADNIAGFEAALRRTLRSRQLRLLQGRHVQASILICRRHISEVSVDPIAN
jgi:hypothetical protein